VPKDGVLGEGG
jgi:hypothetical protein